MSGPLSTLLADLQSIRRDYDLDAVCAHRKLPDGAMLTLTAWRGGVNTIGRDDKELRVVPREARV
jgi:hypothetical protein